MTKDQELEPDPLEGEVPRQARLACQRQLKVSGRTGRIVRTQSSPRPRRAQRRAKAEDAAREIIRHVDGLRKYPTGTFVDLRDITQ